MQVIRKLKALVTGERMDLQTGEVIGRLPGHYEKVDPTPMAPPVGYKREPTLMEKIQLMMLKQRTEELAASLGAESPDEAEDFDVGDPDDNNDPSSPYEFERHEMELLERMERTQQRHLELQRKYPNHNFGPVPFTEELPLPGVQGAKPPAEAAPAAVPAPAKGAPAAPEAPPSADPLPK